MFKVEEENVIQDYENFIIPYDLSKIIIKNCEEQLLTILDIPSQIYGKALHGDCKVEFKNGNQYKGEFYNGMLNGKGELIWADGTVYKGDFVYNKIQGEGEYLFKDGSSYKGEVQNGLRHGQGRYQSKEGEVMYEGQWAWGQREGKGVLEFISGGRYSGGFIKGMKEGRGRMVYPSGHYFEGEWKQDSKEGYGTMVWKGEKYYGLWRDNVQDRLGTHLWMEQRGEGKYLRNRYEGEWLQGQRHSFGTFYYANGSRYVGYWLANYKHGFAKFIDENGKVLKGFFKNDRQLQLQKVQQVVEGEQSLVSQAQSNSQRRQQVSRNEPKRIAVTNTSHPSKEVEANPYYSQLNLDDILDINDPNHQQLQKELYNILLRHNMLLKKIYKQLCLDEGYDFYNQEDETDSENSFSVNLFKVYKLFRECRLLTANASLAKLNRCFFKGVNNRQQLSVLKKECSDMQQLAKQKNILDFQEQVYIQHMINQEYEVPTTCTQPLVNSLSKEVINHLHQMDDESLDEYFYIVQLSQEQQQIQQNKQDNYDIHNGRILVLFRHLVELVVRVTVLREEGCLEGLAKKVEDVIVNRLSHYINDTINKKEQQLDEEKVLGEKFREIRENQALQEIFSKNCTQGDTQVVYKMDQTLGFKKLMEMLQQANLIKGEKELKYLVYLVDRYFDPLHSYSDFTSQHQSAAIQQSVISQKNHNKHTKQERQAMQEREKELEVTKNINLARLFQTQLTYLEFLEILLLLSFRKDNKVSKSLSQSIRSVKSVLRKKPTMMNNGTGQSSNNNGTHNESGMGNGMSSQNNNATEYILYDANKLQQMCSEEQFNKYKQDDKWKVYIQVFIQVNTVHYHLSDPSLTFRTKKDQQRDQLKDQRERERLEELEKKRKEAELEKEEKNRQMLEQEDINILSLEPEDDEEYDSDY